MGSSLNLGSSQQNMSLLTRAVNSGAISVTCFQASSFCGNGFTLSSVFYKHSTIFHSLWTTPLCSIFHHTGWRDICVKYYYKDHPWNASITLHSDHRKATAAYGKGLFQQCLFSQYCSLDLSTESFINGPLLSLFLHSMNIIWNIQEMIFPICL